MSKEEKDHVELELSHSRDKGLSLKAKGAGVILLLCLTIGGMIFLAYTAITSGSDKSIIIMVPIIFLLYLSYSLLAIMGTMFTDNVWGVKPPED
ncbi:hypothetical protein ACSZOF_09130 [Aeromonas veronii]